MKREMNKQVIAVNGRFLAQPATGVQRYAYEIVRAWDAMLDCGEIDPAKYQIEIVAPRLNKPVNDFNHIPIRQIGFMRGNLWEQFELPWYTRGKFLFNPCNIGPVLKLNQAVTIHDASVFAVPWSYSLSFRLKYRTVYSILAKTARVVFTDSQFSRGELQKYCHIPDEKLFVVNAGCDHMERIVPDSSIFQRKHIGDKPYILAVSSNAPHKNVSILGEVSKVLGADIDIIVVGGDDMPWFSNSSANGAIEGVKKLGYVTDEELKALYQNAAAFIFPSLYEGFGLPPLEAMACGCPVICARIPALEEICGDAALYFESGELKELAEEIIILLNDRTRQKEYKSKGIIQSDQYKWSNMANSIWIDIRKILTLSASSSR